MSAHRAKPKVVFHIGLERTGTTSLQQYCVDHNRALRAASVLYPIRGLAFARKNHAPLVNGYLSDESRDFAIGAPTAEKTAVLSSLYREIDAAACDIVLISAEYFSSRFGPPRIRALAADFAEYDRHVVVVVRDHLARLFSSYSIHVVSGGVEDMDAFTDRALAPGSHYCRYAEMIGYWEDVFGRENVAVLPYAPDGDLPEAVLQRFSTGKLSIPPFRAYRENRSLGPTLVEALRLINLRLARQAPSASAKTRADWIRERVVLRLAERWLRGAAVDPFSGRWALEEGRRAQLQAIARSDRQWLLERHGVRLQDESPPLAPAGAERDDAAADLLAQAFLDRTAPIWSLIALQGPALSLAASIGDKLRSLRDKMRR